MNVASRHQQSTYATHECVCVSCVLGVRCVCHPFELLGQMDGCGKRWMFKVISFVLFKTIQICWQNIPSYDLCLTECRPIHRWNEDILNVVQHFGNDDDILFLVDVSSLHLLFRVCFFATFALRFSFSFSFELKMKCKQAILFGHSPFREIKWWLFELCAGRIYSFLSESFQIAFQKELNGEWVEEMMRKEGRGEGKWKCLKKPSESKDQKRKQFWPGRR